MQTVQSTEAKKVITVRTAAFQAADEGGSAAIETVAVPGAVGKSSFVGAELTKSDRPDAYGCEDRISGGRGMGNGENFTKYIERWQPFGCCDGCLARGRGRGLRAETTGRSDDRQGRCA